MDDKGRYVGAMQELKQKLIEYPAKIKDLEALVSNLEEEVSEFKSREVFTNKLLSDLQKGLDQECEENKKLEIEINELENNIENLEQQAFAAAEKIKDLTSENIELMSQVVQEREQKEAYKEDSEKTLEANKELRELLKENNRKLIVFKNALKECLL